MHIPAFFNGHFLNRERTARAMGSKNIMHNAVGRDILGASIIGVGHWCCWAGFSLVLHILSSSSIHDYRMQEECN